MFSRTIFQRTKQVYLNLIYGGNLPFNIPNNVKYRNDALIVDPYIRADLEKTQCALLLDSDRNRTTIRFGN